MSESPVGSEYLLFSEARFEIGGVDQLAPLRIKYPEEPEDEQSSQKFFTDWREFIASLHVRTGTLLKADTVSFLLGAGASKECGGPLIGTVPLDLESLLLKRGISGGKRPRVANWIKCFYTVACTLGARNGPDPVDRSAILTRKKDVGAGAAPELRVNLEELLSQLHRWHSVKPSREGSMRLDGNPPISMKLSSIGKCIYEITSALTSLCDLPTDSYDSRNAFRFYELLLRKILTRPLNLKRTNIFTLNYDTLVEQAADAEGITLLDGFVGSINRTFRPESYDQDLYFPAETTEGRVHRHDRVLHLYKLHGSITWTEQEASLANPYGIQAERNASPGDRGVLIYPTPAKWGESLGMPYAELLRRFGNTIVRPQSVLFVIGYGFGDEHINTIIRQALSMPSFTLVVVSPGGAKGFVKSLVETGDSRVWIFAGETFGTFSGFVEHVLANLHDEEIRREIARSYEALGVRAPSIKDEGRIDDQ